MIRRLVFLLVGAVVLTGCGSAAVPAVTPSSSAAAGPAQFGGQASIAAAPGTVDGFCATVRKAQAVESAPPSTSNSGPSSGQSSGETDSAAALRRLQDVANASPAEIRADFGKIVEVNNQSLQMLAAASDDISKLDRAKLRALRQTAVQPAQRVAVFTKQRCGVDYSPPI